MYKIMTCTSDCFYGIVLLVGVSHRNMKTKVDVHGLSLCTNYYP